MNIKGKVSKFFSTTFFIVAVCFLAFFVIKVFSNRVEGVKVAVLKEGSGKTIKNGDTVAVNYVGSFQDGKVFESNAGEGPFVLTLGSTPVIKGWGMGVEGMKVGEKRNIEISPEYAYGAKGVPGIVPPNAKLVYEVELVEIKN